MDLYDSHAVLQYFHGLWASGELATFWASIPSGSYGDNALNRLDRERGKKELSLGAIFTVAAGINSFELISGNLVPFSGSGTQGFFEYDPSGYIRPITGNSATDDYFELISGNLVPRA